jgi:hypothetical protein
MATIPGTIRAIITGSGYRDISTILAATAALLLIALMVLKELMRVLEAPRARAWIETLNVAILPLLLTFGYILIVRALRLLGLL